MAPMSLSQAWLDKRFKGLTPRDFEDGVRIYCTADLVPPPQLRGVWRSFCQAQLASDRTFSAEEMADVQALLIVSDLGQESQVLATCKIIQSIDALGHDAPVLVCVPHSVEPEAGERKGDFEAEQYIKRVVPHLLEFGLDAMLTGEPEGILLSLAVRSKLHKLAFSCTLVNDVINERRRRSQYAEFLSGCIDCMLWDYLRVRVAPVIPPIDYDLPRGDLRAVDDYAFGPMLGKGMFGSVYRLKKRQETAGGPPECEQVMKVVSKDGISDVPEMKCLRRQIEVMQLLASQEWSHPNLVRLNKIYHSQSHIFFRMDFAGPENLFRRLHHRQKTGDACRPLPLPRCHSLVGQAIAVVTHMHLGPRVCHRDLKPENFIVEDVPPQPLVLKLADFDLSVLQVGGATCSGCCGTLPFVAPEVFFQRQYSGLSADIWSLGMVLLEVFCGLRVIEEAAGLNQKEKSGGAKAPADDVWNKISRYFSRTGSVRSLLDAKARPELASLVEAMAPMLDGMISVRLADRWSAADTLAAWEALNAAVLAAAGRVEKPVEDSFLNCAS